MAITRKTAKKRANPKAEDNYQFHILGFLITSLFFIIFFNRPSQLLEGPNQNREILVDIETPIINVEDKNENTTWIFAKPHPEFVEHGIGEIDKNVFQHISEKNSTDIIIVDKYPRNYTKIAGLSFQTENQVMKSVLFSNINFFLFRLMNLDTNIRNIHTRYSKWIDGVKDVLGQNIIFRIEEYYQVSVERYNLTDRHIFWSGENMAGMLEISIYRNNNWVNRTSVYVF